MKTWGQIYYKWLRKGYDPGYAAWLADRYICRKEAASQSTQQSPTPDRNRHSSRQRPSQDTLLHR